MSLLASMQLISHKVVEWKAAGIDDPVARLRFLRQKFGVDPESEQAGRVPRQLTWQRVAFGFALVCMLIPGARISNARDPMLFPLTRTETGIDAITEVWLVDKTAEFETYSNGLRIDNRHTSSNEHRVFYPVYQRSAINPATPEWRSQPAGIVFHTTESEWASFEAGETKQLKRIGGEVLTFVARNHAYHFLIDRFGQVFRIVPETDIANHAGVSVWADDSVIYVNLNSSFLGIAFETQTQKGQDLPSANPAQIHAARVLTQMLRSKYHIPAANCVTHAQVSVNPSNMLVGYHTDWSGNFPFHEVGLNDNYSVPPASIYAFGFDYDPAYVHATGVRVWQGLAMAEDQMRAQAAAQGIPVSKFRSILQKKYKEIITTLKASSTAKEKSNAA
jgi:hypothetical protein